MFAYYAVIIEAACSLLIEMDRLLNKCCEPKYFGIKNRIPVSKKFQLIYLEDEHLCVAKN